MASGTIQIPMSQIPDSLIEQISGVLHSYSATLIKIPATRNGPEQPIQIGSGTFVSLGNTFGILTAQHVARELGGNCSLGLALIQDEHVRSVKKDYLEIIDIASAVNPAEGPDLSFIILPDPDVSTIKASKSFYDLSFDKEFLLNNPPTLDSGIWFICGTPGEKTQIEESEKWFGRAMAFRGFAFATGANREYVKEDYDYIEGLYRKNSNIHTQKR